MILDSIQKPNDIKSLSAKDLISEIIITTINKSNKLSIVIMDIL